jgi:hypothetical protein
MTTKRYVILSHEAWIVVRTGASTPFRTFLYCFVKQLISLLLHCHLTVCLIIFELCIRWPLASALPRPLPGLSTQLELESCARNEERETSFVMKLRVRWLTSGSYSCCLQRCNVAVCLATFQENPTFTVKNVGNTLISFYQDARCHIHENPSEPQVAYCYFPLFFPNTKNQAIHTWLHAQKKTVLLAILRMCESGFLLWRNDVSGRCLEPKFSAGCLCLRRLH